MYHMTYPLKFRQKVFVVKDKFHLTFEQTSERFDIPIRTLFRWQNKLEPCLTRTKQPPAKAVGSYNELKSGYGVFQDSCRLKL